jgi:hypothetical protein
MIKTVKLVKAQERVLKVGADLIEAQHDYNNEIKNEVNHLESKVKEQYNMGLVNAKEYFKQMTRIYSEAYEASIEPSYEVGDVMRKLDES